MKKVLLMVALTLLAPLSHARDKSGLTLTTGVSTLTGEMSTISWDSTTGLAVGIDYTFTRGFIFGSNYVHELASLEVPGNDFKMNMLDIYAGYELDNSVRITGGVSGGVVTNNGYYNRGYDEFSGINVAVGYTVADALLVELRYTGTVNDYSTDASKVQLTLGHKF